MKINKILKSVVFAGLALVAVGCSVDDEISSINFPYTLTPVNFKASSPTASSVVLEWNTVTAVDSCVVEFFAGDDDDFTMAKSDTVVPSFRKVLMSSPDTVKGLEPQTTYSARIKACGSKGESKYTYLEKTFKTKKGGSDPTPTPKDKAVLTFTAGVVEASYTFGCITMDVNNSGAKISVEGNTQYFGDDKAQTKYETRLKTGGASSASNGITLTSTGTGTLTIAMRSSNGSVTRTVSVEKDGEVVQTFTVEDANCTKDVAVPGEEGTKTVFKYYTMNIVPGTYTFNYDGGVNFYALEIEYTEGDGGDSEEEEEEGEAGDPIMMQFSEKLDSYTFGEISILVDDPDAKAAVDANTAFFADPAGGNPLKFTNRFKTGSKKTSLTISVPSDGKLYIFARTGSNAATDRPIVVTQNGTELVNQIVQEADAQTGVIIEGESEPKNVYPAVEVSLKKGNAIITTPVNSCNIYGMYFKP